MLLYMYASVDVCSFDVHLPGRTMTPFINQTTSLVDHHFPELTRCQICNPFPPPNLLTPQTSVKSLPLQKSESGFVALAGFAWSTSQCSMTHVPFILNTSATASWPAATFKCTNPMSASKVSCTIVRFTLGIKYLRKAMAAARPCGA